MAVAVAYCASQCVLVLICSVEHFLRYQSMDNRKYTLRKASDNFLTVSKSFFLRDPCKCNVPAYHHGST
jgi:uncharacterized protein (DUF2384 family)